MFNSLFAATETLQIEHGVHQNCLKKDTESNTTGKRCALSSLLKKYLFSQSLLKARQSASTFLRFVNIARLLKIDKYMLNDHH